jgi:hypothetical protein
VQHIELNGRKQTLQTRFASAGNDALVRYGPTGYWQYLDCFLHNVTGDIFGINAPIHCSARSEGGSSIPHCSSIVNEASCTATPGCGWCGMNMICTQGYLEGVCSSILPTCPLAAWKFVDNTPTSGGFTEARGAVYLKRGLKVLEKISFFFAFRRR